MSSDARTIELHDTRLSQADQPGEPVGSERHAHARADNDGPPWGSAYLHYTVEWDTSEFGRSEASDAE